MNNVDRAYEQLKKMIVTCQLRPGERLNISVLAGLVGASRTPVREALNRLASEGLCERNTENGFVAGSFHPKRIFDLYEMRAIIECGAVALAVRRASHGALAALEATARKREEMRAVRDNDQLVSEDEDFHETIAKLSGNAQIVRNLRNVNAQIRFLRGIDRGKRSESSAFNHVAIADAMLRSDVEGAQNRMRQHITRRMDQIIEMINSSVMHIYGAAVAEGGYGQSENIDGL
jgi:DNA-binding GntR family transcriptional regulator